MKKIFTKNKHEGTTVFFKKDTGVIFKVVKRRWYHKYFKQPSDGIPLCEMSGIQLCLTKNGKFYLDIGGMEGIAGHYYFNKNI